ncbi:NADPH-adrenodoxin reductase [Coemansia guatemalensis]|uniref:NADPH:adrenodoxin oxidoreductase, mitochondrial n=1 Tax=Coemansia guatemalensis TaxID=2761395 RepID=A0A9W8LV45_9FUNG|nr:NADPH-adrenodoxin reductase [Coemansia guatemalensis]
MAATVLLVRRRAWSSGLIATGRQFSTCRIAEREKNIAVVGGGAAGFYTAARILQKASDTNIDIFEKLPTPHGLVRYGVAPDHPEVKNCMSKFDDVAGSERVRFFGNVQVCGTSDKHQPGFLSLDSLRSVYDGVVLSYGASKDRRLNIPGEDGKILDSGDNNNNRLGVVSARQFVAWYNGLPEAQELELDLESYDKIVVIGHGNVALDCARILLTDVNSLASTDITEQALKKLSGSKIRHVEIVGRRGPLQVSFTTKELREMTKLDNVQVICDRQLLESECQSAAGQAYLQQSRALKRMMDLLLKHSVASEDASKEQKSFKLSFLKSPVEMLFDQKWNENGSEIIVPQLFRFQINRLEGPPESAKAVSTDSFTEIPCAMALRSIGYVSTPLDGAPFDKQRNIVPNIAGRVVDNGVVPGLYVSGWVKRGPVGVIATTMQDAYRTADALVMDINNGHVAGDNMPQSSRSAIDRMLEDAGVAQSRVTNDDWKRLEEFEIEKGRQFGKPREKVTDVQEMLSIIRNSA